MAQAIFGGHLLRIVILPNITLETAGKNFTPVVQSKVPDTLCGVYGLASPPSLPYAPTDLHWRT